MHAPSPNLIVISGTNLSCAPEKLRLQSSHALGILQANLADFQGDLGIDQGSRVMDPSFTNLNALDCRVKPEAMAALSQCYPQTPVPGVLLGVQP